MNAAEAAVLQLVQQDILEIDDQGQVWRKAVRRGGHRVVTRTVPIQRKRVENWNKSGYLYIPCNVDGKAYFARAHRVVWIYFFGDIPGGMEINHINGVKTDNRPANLELATRSQNAKHAVDHGLVQLFGAKGHIRRGKANVRSKLCHDIVLNILADYESGQFSQDQLAQRYDVGQTTISRVVRHRHWASTQ